MVSVRLMAEDDLEAVRQVDAMAFDAWWKRLYGPQAGLPRRTLANLAACRERDPEGCFVAQKDGLTVGYLFCRTWGGVGWLGPLAVLPQHQGRGIGRLLVLAGMDYLRRQPGRVIGLETMTESPDNLGLYLRQGFQVSLPAVLLSRALAVSVGGAMAQVSPGAFLPFPSAPEAPGLHRWSLAGAAERERWLAQLREAAGLILPGLDYSQEVLCHERHGLGETLVLVQGGRAVGLSTLALTGAREGGDGGPANLQALALHPAHTSAATFRALLEATEALARSASSSSLKVPVHARHAWALGLLPQWGYRVERVVVRMVLEGTEAGPLTDRWVDLSRWAG